jgi:hypothetical protein
VQTMLSPVFTIFLSVATNFIGQLLFEWNSKEPHVQTKNLQPELFQDNGKDRQNTKVSLSFLINWARDIMQKNAILHGLLDGVALSARRLLRRDCDAGASHPLLATTLIRASNRRLLATNIAFTSWRMLTIRFYIQAWPTRWHGACTNTKMA